MCRILLVFALLAFSFTCASAATVNGKVIGPEGQAIKGASVLLQMHREQKTLELLTDGAGAFAVSIDLADRQPYSALATVTVYAPGYALSETTLNESDTVITLNPGATLSGTAVDSAGKPLAGVPVRLLQVLEKPEHPPRYRENDYTSSAVPDAWRSRFAAVSAADGAWTLPGVPRTGGVILMLDDDRYVREQKQITWDDGVLPAPVRFTARAGAMVTGRVLTPEGQPVSDATVRGYAQDNSATGKTSPDGSYRLTGLASGSYTIEASSEQLAWLAEPLHGIALTEGEVTVAPDLRVYAGAALEGTVVDAETGKPLPRASLRLYRGKVSDNASCDFRDADERGHFLFRVAPGRYALLVKDVPHGYLRRQDAQAETVDLQTGQTVNITVKLHKGLTLTGTLTDGQGIPAAWVHGCIIMPGNGGDASGNALRFDYWFTTDQHGHFTATGLPAGKGTLKLYSAQGKFSEWVLPVPMAIALPAKAPISVRVTHILLHTVHGRVVDARRCPLAAVTAVFQISVPSASAKEKTDYTGVTVVTGANGEYQLAIPAGAEIKLFSLEKRGYRSQQVLETGDQYTNLHTMVSMPVVNGTIDDIVMLAISTVIHGKVCDAEGKPVPGATVVSAEVGLKARAITDAAGAFTLENQPGDELHLIAATPTGGGLATCKAWEPAVITCTRSKVANPTDIPLARQLLDADSRLPERQRCFSRAETLRAIADVDLDAALKLCETGAKPIPDALRAYLLGKQAARDPEKVGEIIVQLNLLGSPAYKLYAAVEMGIAAAKSDPELAEQLYGIAKPLYDRLVHDQIDIKFTEGLGMENCVVRTLAFAKLLQKTEDVDAMLGELTPRANESSNKGKHYMELLLYKTAARVRPEFVIKVYNRLDNGMKHVVLCAAVRHLETRDPESALRLLKALWALDKLEGHSYEVDVMPTIKALGKRDPEAALALAKTLPGGLQPKAMLAAAAYQTREAAGTLLRDNFPTRPSLQDIGNANALDPDFAQSVYAKNKENLLKAEADASAEGRARFAYLLSSLDPVEARLLLETEFAHALATDPNGTQPGKRQYALSFFPRAMNALDLDRAHQMLDAIIAHTHNRWRVNDALGDAGGIERFVVTDSTFRKYVEQRMMRYIILPRAERVSEALY